MKLNELRDNPGARKKPKRVGRGPGSGTGKTAGRGTKGQKSRSGVAMGGYEGGQMPVHMRLPKQGFNQPNRLRFSIVNLGLIEKFIREGKLNTDAVITEDLLVESGLVRRKLDGVRVLAKGEINSKVSIRVTGASRAAVEAIEMIGGSVELLPKKAISPDPMPKSIEPTAFRPVEPVKPEPKPTDEDESS